MAPAFDWSEIFLSNSPVSTPNYTTPLDSTAPRPRNDYSGSMARIYTFQSAAELAGGVFADLTRAATPDVPYIDFLLQTYNHSLAENVHVAETLDDLYSAYSFGRMPPTFTYTAVLLNNKQDRQVEKFQRLYDFVLRANRLAHDENLMTLQYDTYIVKGYMTGLNISVSANDESYAQASFQVLVKGYRCETPTPRPTGTVKFASIAQPQTAAETPATPTAAPALAAPAPPAEGAAH